VCVCVYVRERERKRERDTGTENQKKDAHRELQGFVNKHIYRNSSWLTWITVEHAFMIAESVA
jgi:hypothetical protein